MPEIESIEKHADLIYDVGMHKGEDSDFYLKKGFKVIGFEADPQLVDHCKKKFSREIEQGNLTIVEGAIIEHTGEVEPQSVRFYQNQGNSVWGTIQEDWARRNETFGAPSNTFDVKAVDFVQCLRQFGIPYYLKIDIEGCDVVCLRALANFELKPDYVSIESEKITFAKLLREFHLFRRLGYTAFKAVQQAGMSSRVEPTECREGSYLAYKFVEGASGVFGEDLPGKWKNYYEILAEYRMIFVLYNLFGDRGKLNSFTFSKWPKELLRKCLGRPIPGWYDSHARHSTHVPKARF
jgi:FkbM family methyltransferase